ncbi:MAG: copper-binding protein [Xanthomonadales bacterium]|nr:copper-binding protein [Xanthomonadales bacterium]
MKILIAPLLSIALLAGCSEESGNVETVATPVDTAAPAVVESTTAPMAGADAQSMGMSEADHQAMGMATGEAAADGITATASGTVESIDPATGKIVIAHGPVAALEWPAMTMGFTATPEQVAAVQTGQEVNFEFLSQGADNTITSITPAQ